MKEYCVLYRCFLAPFFADIPGYLVFVVLTVPQGNGIKMKKQEKKLLKIRSGDGITSVISMNLFWIDKKSVEQTILRIYA